MKFAPPTFMRWGSTLSRAERTLSPSRIHLSSSSRPRKLMPLKCMASQRRLKLKSRSLSGVTSWCGNFLCGGLAFLARSKAGWTVSSPCSAPTAAVTSTRQESSPADELFFPSPPEVPRSLIARTASMEIFLAFCALFIEVYCSSLASTYWHRMLSTAPRI